MQKKFLHTDDGVLCVCVCERERERERVVCVCVHRSVSVCLSDFLLALVLSLSGWILNQFPATV